MKDEQPQTSSQPTIADAGTNTANVAKGESDDVQNTPSTGREGVKVTSLTPEQEIEKLKKRIAVLTMERTD